MKIPVFGVQEPGRSYVERLGAYGFLRDSKGMLALVRTPMGVFLPGGGLDPGETLEEGLRREIFEEIGLHVSRSQFVAEAIQFHWSEYYQQYFKKVGSFFFVEVKAYVPVVLQAEHELLWWPVPRAAAELSQEFQRWAVREAFPSSGLK